ncbi:hypothetical protein LINGRAHAP2_LOCUS24103, partial [Linum grandiflorum]
IPSIYSSIPLVNLTSFHSRIERLLGFRNLSIWDFGERVVVFLFVPVFSLLAKDQMARCFPYPPPEGFLGNVAFGRASIAPIKPHGQTVKIETGNGKTNPEKLLKRECSRNKEEETKSKRFKLTKTSVDSPKVKVEDDESSGVSEEYGLPCHSLKSVKSSNTTCAADNLQERKRKTIRIRLNVTKSEGPICCEKPCLPSATSSQQKQNDAGDDRSRHPVATLQKHDRPRQPIAAALQQKDDRPRQPIAAALQQKDDRPRQPIAAALQQEDDRPRQPIAAALEASTSLPDLKMKEKDISTTKVGRNHNNGSRRENKKMSIYEALINGWSAPPLPAEQSESEDLGWLTTSRKCGSSSRAHSNNVASLSTRWPKAQCLPEVDLYALPYTVPF